MSIRFPASWPGDDLDGYRSRGRFLPIESLPPLDGKAFDGSFSWFAEHGDVSQGDAAEIRELTRALGVLGLDLPEDFATFHEHRELRNSFNNGCYWTHISRPLPSPVEPDAYIVRFLRDQQDCVIFYLYLRLSGESFIVHSYELNEHLDYLDPDEPWADEEPELDVDDLISCIHWCAPTFEEFAYRWLIEGQIICVINNTDGTFDAEQRAYLSHYVTAVT